MMTSISTSPEASNTSAGQTTGEKTQGIAIIANDKVINWLVPFLESYLATSASIPLYLIPYDDNHAKTKRIAEIYGVTFADVDSQEVDALSRRLYPFSPGKRHRLRKFLSLTLPLDEVIYLDVDIILFQNFRDLLGHLEPGKTDFIVVARSETIEYVYNKRHADYDYLKDAFLFNDGFFITSNKILSVQDFYDAMREDEAVFHRVRDRGGLFAQPLCNFVTHRKRLKIRPVHELVAGASPQSYHKAENVTFGLNGPIDDNGKRIYFAHWPGVIGMPKRLVFDAAWQAHADAGAARLKSAGL